MMLKTIRLEKLAILVLLLSALILAARAQTYFETQAQENWDAAVPAMLGAVLLFSRAAFLANRTSGEPAESGSPALPENQLWQQSTDFDRQRACNSIVAACSVQAYPAT